MFGAYKRGEDVDMDEGNFAWSMEFVSRCMSGQKLDGFQTRGGWQCPFLGTYVPREYIKPVWTTSSDKVEVKKEPLRMFGRPLSSTGVPHEIDLCSPPRKQPRHDDPAVTGPSSSSGASGSNMPMPLPIGDIYVPDPAQEVDFSLARELSQLLGEAGVEDEVDLGRWPR